MVQINGKERLQLHSKLFGTPRLMDSFQNSNDVMFQNALPLRIENINGLNDIVNQNFLNDIIPEGTPIRNFSINDYNETQRGGNDNNNIYTDNNNNNDEGDILHKRTHIRKFSDTRSLSNADNTPSNSPHKVDNQDFSPRGQPQQLHPTGSINPPLSVDNDRSLREHDDNIRRSRSELMPMRKPSLPQLAISGLKKQSTFSNNNTTPTQSKKSPLQGFGFFSRPSSKDLHESQAFQEQNYQSQQALQSQQENISTGRSMSINSSTLRNFKSSFQAKKSSQNYDTSTNFFADNNSRTTQSNSQNFTTSGSNGSSNVVGLGLKSRHSSTSLMSKRYTSGSGTIVSHRHNSSSSSPSNKPYINSPKKPLVYPALLSRLATKFKSTIQLGEYKKDGLLYRDAFTGQKAVSTICSIIRTSDRNLALLLGRSLDAQKLFHDVVYEHRLRDSPNEIYEFTDNSRIIGTVSNNFGPMNSEEPLMLYSSSTNVSLLCKASSASLSTEQTEQISNPAHQMHPAKRHNVNGVFTLLADCYSATCTNDKLCYSISCPRRLEQQARLNLKPDGGLKRNVSMNLDDDEIERQSWISSVSEDVWKDLPKKEIKRQEAIYEVFSTEKNFIKSLEVTRDTFMKSLSETNIISADIRKNFIKHVFAHINDIYSVNRRFFDAISERQKSSPVVRGIGDIVLRFIPFFEPFVSYVASRPYAKYLIETQRSVNPYFARFDDDMMNSSLRHGIDSFLSQGVSRPGRYMLLVREIMKSSDPEKDSRDIEFLNKATDSLRDFMKRIDKASGAAQDRHDVKLLKQKILFKNEYVNLGLNDEKRKIKHEGILSRKEVSKSDDIIGDIQFYLLDNLLLFLKSKSVNKWHQHKVFQRPIPLPLLFVVPGEEPPNLRKHIGFKPDCSGVVIQPDSNILNPRNAMTFVYYGAKQKYQVTLYAAQFAGLQTLLSRIKLEQERIIAETSIINVTKISDKFFDYSNKINSVVSCDGGRKLLIATNSGLYMSNIRRQPATEAQTAQILFSTPVQLIQRNNITQVGVLDEFKSILLLIDKKLYTCPLALLDVEGNATSYFKKHSKELINHVNFFAEGDCNGKRLVVTAHSHAIKYFEHEHPLLAENGGTSKKNLKKKITEVTFDSELVSISFLKANLCIGCKKGFQIVSIFRNAYESLLDSADTSLDFALKDTSKPMAIYRVGNMFLLCYTEFAFFVNNQGWRKKDSHIINWEGEPQKFAIWYPYILAFDANFIEIRNIDTGELVRCILGEKIRLLQTSSQEILYVYEDSRGYDTVASLDFWS